MKVTFLVGNGYDLNLGLRTTYKDFYKNYVSKLGLKVIENNVLYDSISTDIEDWVDFETRLGLFTFPVNNTNKIKLIAKSKKLSDDNTDIENEINDEINLSNKKFISSLTDFRKDFKKYLTMESEKISKYERALGVILYHGLSEFATDFKDNDKISIYSNMAKNIIRYTDKKNTATLRIEYSFLTFNYTDFLEIGKKSINTVQLSEALSKSFADENQGSVQVLPYMNQVYHIHSKLSDGMFLGVDNETQLYSKRFNEKQLTSLIKPLSNEKFNNNITDKADKELFSSDLIVIYGMALGITDLTWWKKIITFLKNNQNNIVLIHKFDLTINTEDDDFYTLADIKEEIKDNLLSFDDTLSLDEISNLKTQIFVSLNSPNIFESSNLRNIMNSKDSKPTFSEAVR